MKIGETIRIFRIANDYTISKLSNLSGISRSYLSELENGKKGKYISTTTLNSLEETFNVPHGSILKICKISEEKNLDFKQTLFKVLCIMMKK